MASLIENVVSLEAQANKIIEIAHSQAKDIENGAEVELRAQQAALEEEVTRRLDAFRQAGEARHEEELHAAEREFAAAIEAVDRLDVRAVQAQVDRVLAQFKEL